MSTPMIQKKNGVDGIEKAMALSVSASYCKENGYSIDKLENKRLYVFENEAFFAAPSQLKANGLVNDMETRPVPVLILKFEDGKILFEKTEHTDSYLK